MKRILATGGSGFIGSHLCDCLIKSGDDFLCVDNFLTGFKINITHLLGYAAAHHTLIKLLLLSKAPGSGGLA